jgi:predicted nucleic acid-binding protein
MIYKVFADANVYLELFLQRGSDWKGAEILFELAEQKQMEVYTSASNVLNLMYVMGTHKLSRQKIIKHASALLQHSTLVSPDNSVFGSALASGFLDLEDAVQYFTAMNVDDMDYFITSNTRDFKKASAQLPVLTPSQFLKTYNKIIKR